MCNDDQTETVLPINEQQRTVIYDDINHAIEQLRYALTRLADYAEIVGEPEPDQFRVLQRDTIRCVHAFSEATRALARQRQRRTRANRPWPDNADLEHSTIPKSGTTHPLAGTINNSPAARLDRTGEYHDTDTPDETSPHRYTDNK